MDENRDFFHLRRAYKAALSSPDPRTQNGALLIGNGYLVEACNTFPAGVAPLPERLERPLKYSYLVHAEQNAILTAVSSGYRVPGTTLYCPWACCSACSRAIIQSGVIRLVVDARYKDMASTPQSWVEEVAIGWTMLAEAGVTLDFIEGPFSIKLRLDGLVTEV